MISICIPIYNFDATELIHTLQKQAERLSFECELLIIDDGSNQEFKKLYRNLPKMLRYIELPENVGRAKIRNLFLEYSTNPYLLFLDCDSIVFNSYFLSIYTEMTDSSPDVVCGGREYPSEKPDQDHLLRWKYGIKRESKRVEERKKDPNRSFMTNNFMIKRALLEEIRFDERLTKYGHEDTLFGIELAKKGITITHIENSVLNGDVETNQVFLKKTEEGMDNLIQILEFTEIKKELIKNISLLKMYSRIKVFKPLLKPVFKLLNPIIRAGLSKWGISVTLFNIYKLGYFIIHIKSSD